MPADMAEAARWQARVAHATAAGTVPWQHASLATGLVGAACGLAAGPDVLSGLLAVLHLVLLAAGLWIALRLRVDAVLFGALAGADGTDAFDAAMLELGLLDPGKAGRSMPERVAGLMRWVRRMAVVVAAQLALLIATGWLAWR